MAATASKHDCTYQAEAVGGLVDRINQPNWSPARTAKHNLCLERIFAILPNGALSKDVLPSPPSLATMQALLQELDTLVFRKSISARCDFAWDPQLSVGSQIVKGLCQTPVNGRIIIKLNSSKCHTWWEIVETLLHEMVHGWLFLHGYDRSCGKESPCRKMSAMGATGHGWAFHKISLAVERCAQKALVNIRSIIELNRWQSAVHEHKVSDPEMADRCLMEFFAEWEQHIIVVNVRR
ncbi:hypothetical protein CLAFUW4_04189 [Fulvia fulva]|uniref:SprT-like domain-containing protein n=1 Tax=Passalora fulva TaxID=5499 RepID=A0A9Q8LEP3_PASFU|nr:uncharacterized protein CLAFUR5_04152 [Fulvia fulva]KAK4626617.1 hypothetical protein CLAFUR4_04175 [Fulvia fulva]KAK4627560.1 hypothetical protein CLAFUR0_04175 [Fulvia fulva]UJO16161.1 hypothetical protein CLAFUR5_04152 [Fulvia fulva]WPV13574.1 hypothetical protein CLAFUW4_04189 [Fulvia fulva]WPV28300.1 hypothetical protein CLAFUW7_04178 [Fulvia fulva]